MNSTEPVSAYQTPPAITDLQRSFLFHLQYALVKDKYFATKADLYPALPYAVRDMLAERWLDTLQTYSISNAKRVYYISMEFLMGRTLFSNDRTIAEYAGEIRGIRPEKVRRHSRQDLQ